MIFSRKLGKRGFVPDRPEMAGQDDVVAHWLPTALRPALNSAQNWSEYKNRDGFRHPCSISREGLGSV
jgi:hypothetical protein